MLNVKSRARKQNVGLTIPIATRQARRIVDEIMPGVGATVESRGSADSATLERVIVTTITFPGNMSESVKFSLWTQLASMPGAQRAGALDSARVTVTRSVR